MRDQQRREYQLQIEKDKQRSIALMMRNQKQAEIENRLRAMEAKRKALQQVNSYTNKVVHDLLEDKKGLHVNAYALIKHAEDDMHMAEFLEKKQVGDKYLKESYHDVRNRSATRHSGSHHESQGSDIYENI